MSNFLMFFTLTGAGATLFFMFQGHISLFFYYITTIINSALGSLGPIFTVSPLIVVLYFSIPFFFFYSFLRNNFTNE